MVIVVTEGQVENISDDNTAKNESNTMLDEAITSDTKPASKQKKERKNKGVFKAVIQLMFNWNTISLLLSHHPECETFDSHVFKIGKVRICKGCTLSYPPAYGIPILFIAWGLARDFILASDFYIQNIWWFVIGTGIIAIGNHFMKPLSLFINDLAKVTRGIFAGFLILAILIVTPWYFKFIPLAVIAAGLVWMSVKRQKDMSTTCTECEWQNDYENCPGWKDFSVNLQNSLNYPQKDTKPMLSTEPLENPVEEKIGIETQPDTDIQKTN